MFPLHLSNSSALTGNTQTRKFHLFTQMLHYRIAFPDFNQSLPDFFDFVDLQLSRCCRLPKSYNQL